MESELSPDDQAILLLCSRLEGRDDRKASGTSAYALGEWNKLARLLHASDLKRPGSLLGLEASAIATATGVLPAEAERIAHLLERGGMLGIELERLASVGIRATTRASSGYPLRLKEKLRELAPPVVFYSGDLTLGKALSLAIVGSRNVDEAGEAFTERISRWAARRGVTIISGAARGVDVISMRSAFDAGGTVVGVPADSLERLVRQVDIRSALAEERLLLLTPYHPRTSFSIGNAMGRNKLIYCLANWTLVVAAEMEKGGSWAGAVECLRAGWTPVFARSSEAAPEGNSALIHRGALPFPSDFDEEQPTDELFARLATKHIETQPVTLRAAASEHPARMLGSESTESTDWQCFLEQPRGEDELVRHFAIPRAEVRARLKELIGLGRVRRITRPAVRYQTVPMKL